MYAIGCTNLTRRPSVCFYLDFVNTAAFDTDGTMSPTTSASANVPHEKYQRYTKKRSQKVVPQCTRDSVDSDVNPKTRQNK